MFIGLAASVMAAGVATAALLPGTPLEVEAGVPGHGRVWETVTPEDVTTAYLDPKEEEAYVSSSGERVFFRTYGLLPGAPEQGAIASPAFATRAAGGWTDSWLPSPYYATYPELAGVNSDLSQMLWRGELPNGEPALFRSSLDGSFATLISTPPEMQTIFVGTSEDLRRVFVSTTAHLLPEDAERSGASLYEVDDGGIHLVDVDSEGQLLSKCGSTVNQVGGSEVAPGTVSQNGHRVFFTTKLETGSDCSFGTTKVFLREDGARTVEISASQCDLADCGEEGGVGFVGATATGSSAYLTTNQRLTDDDTDSAESLYRYDVASGKLTLLTPSSAELRSPRDISPSSDGLRTYFVADKEGSTDLFLADADGLHEIAPITIATGSPLQVSASGRYAAFVTLAALDSRDSDASPDVYRYDADSGSSVLISAGSAGGNGSAGASFFSEVPFKTETQLKLPPNRPAKAMSEDGGEIFFETQESLLPEDHNGVSDVYEWDEGSLSLISSGAGETGSTFVGSTPDGSTAFFETADTLVPRDRDGSELDLYAARIGGGFPEPSPVSGCEGQACRNTVAAPPPRPTTRSAKRLKRIEVGKPGAAARRRMATTGKIDLLIEAPRRGTLHAKARARVGRRSSVVAKAGVKVAKPGPLDLRMGLSAAARARLAAGHDLKLQLRLTLGQVPPVSTLIELEGR